MNAFLFFVLVSVSNAQPIPQFTIQPFAGLPHSLGDSGPATSALLNSPHGVAVDRTGNIYITDTSDNLLRRVSPAGIITTVSNAVLFPWGTAVAPNGDVYVADAANNRILKLSALGIPSPFATSATLNSPRDVAVDTSGNVFILDTGNNRVLKVKPDGAVTPYAGSGAAGYLGDGNQAIYAQLNFPYAIALDASGDLFIADSVNHRIRAVTPDGIMHTVAGDNSHGYNGNNAPQFTTLNYPSGVAVDLSGTLYVADTENNLIRKITQPLASNAAISTIAGTTTPGFLGDGGLAGKAQLNYPRGIAIDSQGNLLIADSQNNRVRKIDAQGIISTVAGSDPGSGDGGPSTSARFFQPSGVAVDSTGNVYIADTNNNRVRRVTANGVISTFAGNGTPAYSGDGFTAASASLNGPNGLAFDAAGNLYIADTENHVIRKVGNGIISTVVGTGISGNAGDDNPAVNAQLYHPNAIAFDKSGNMYIADSGNNRIRVVTGDGDIHNFAGDGAHGLPGFDGDTGPAQSAHLNYPRGIDVDTNGNVYIADFFNNRVRMVSSSSHNITTVAGPDSQLALPAGIRFDTLGFLYIADSLNSRIAVLTPNGNLTTVAGAQSAGDSGDGGPAIGAAMSSPRDLAIDSKGTIYFSDQDNDRVRKLVPGLVSIGSVVNSASLTGGAVAPGEMVTLFGVLLAPDGVASPVPPANTLSLSTTAANTQVFFDGIAAPLTYVSGTQINAVVPYQVAGHTTTQIMVQAQNRLSDPLNVPVVDTVPGIFANYIGAVLNQDWSQNTPANPAHAGDVVVLFATGEGQTNPPGVTGKLAIGIAPLPVLPVTLQIGGQPVSLAYAAEMPTGAGVLQVNAVVPAGISGDRVPVTLTVGSTPAQSGITMAIR